MNRLSEQRKKEKEAKDKLNKLMKMKPRGYKNISDKEKNDIKFSYDYEKTNADMLEEEIKNLEDMNALDYLGLLNEETKEKLIGLCMDRGLFKSFDDKTINGETDIDGEEDDEEP